MGLEIKLLGEVDVRIDGGTVTFTTRRSLLLLAILAAAGGRPCARGKITSILWSDRGEAQARASLRQELYNLRRSLGSAWPQPLQATSEFVVLDADATSIDVVAFERAVAGDAEGQDRALELYRGDLLDGVSGAGPEFEEWLAGERQRLRDLAVLALDRTRQRHVARGATGEAIAAARRLLALDPLREDVCRDLMRLLWNSGQRGATLRQYQAYSAALQRQLGIEPEAETTALYKALLAQAEGQIQTVETSTPPSPPVATVPATAPAAAIPAGGTGHDPSGSLGGVVDGAQAAVRQQVLPAERRHLTVLACELEATPQGGGNIDAEDLHEIVRAYRQHATAIVARFDGHLAELMGLGLVITLGHVQAREDDAERAIRVALALSAEIAALRPVPQIALALRIGIATGPVVVRAAEQASEPALVGDAPAMAASLCATSPLGTVTIGERTHRLAGGLFDCVEIATEPPSHRPDPGRCWRVIGEAAAASRFEALRAVDLAPMVGREQELQLLLDRWEDAAGGEGRTVVLSGESGIGKSRLVAALRARIADIDHQELRYQCSPIYPNRAFYPFISELERAAGADAGDTAEARRAKLLALFQSIPGPVDEPGTAWSGLLALAGLDADAEQRSSAQSRKAAAFVAIQAQLQRLTAQRPVLLVFEDAHWSDPTSLELLERLVDASRDTRVLAVVTCRPDIVLPWHRHPHVTSLSLGRLSRRQSAAVIAHIMGETVLPAEVLDEILARTDGVPLFVEEVTRAVLRQRAAAADAHPESGPDRAPLEIPVTLEHSLLARLGGHPADREVVEIGAVLGREFTRALLVRLAGLPDAAQEEVLERLVECGIFLPRGVGPDASYAFRHALVRDAAYASLLKSRRRQLHARAAAALEEIGQRAAALAPDLLAYHWTKAGELAKAIAYRLRAGRLALDRSAMTEAVAQFEDALGALTQLPDRAERGRQEIELNVALGAALAAAQGTGAAATGQAYRRAVDLCEANADTTHLMPALYGIIRFHVSLRELGSALALAERAVAAASRGPDKVVLAVASYVMGWVSLALGRSRAAEENLRRVLALLDADRQRRVREACGIDLRILAKIYLSWCALAHARPQATQRLVGEALAEAEALAHPLTLAATLDRACMVAGLLGNATELAGLAQRLASVGRTQCFPSYLWVAEFAQAWAEAECAPAEARKGCMQAALNALHGNGDEECGSYYSAVLAGTLAREGKLAEAEELLAGALAQVNRTGERCFEAEILRAYAALLLRADRAPEAQTMLMRAIDTAREQEAPFWELRATLDLARLWRGRGETRQAAELRAALLQRFAAGSEATEFDERESLRDLLNIAPMAGVI